MVEKYLGKIDYAEIGKLADYPFMFGLLLAFSLEGGRSCVCDGGRYTVNLSKECEWEETERQQAIAKATEHVYDILNTAKVKSVSDLVGIPVEVTIENNVFKDFRILTEVL